MSEKTMRTLARTKCTRKTAWIKIVCVLTLAIFTILLLYPKIHPDHFSAHHLDVWQWYTDRFSICEGNYTGYGHRFFKLSHGYVDPSYPEIFTIECKTDMLPPAYRLIGEYAPQRYTASLRQILSREKKSAKVLSKFTVAIHREYPHNFYHSMTQWFNTFILSKFFGIDWRDMNILLLDGGPKEQLDTQWDMLYKSVTKVRHLKSPTIFKEIVFSIPGHESPLFYMAQKELPGIEEFSKTFLDKFGFKQEKRLDCNNLTITVVFRRDYVWHLGSKDETERVTERKFKNEDEILHTIRKAIPEGNVKVMISEEMTISDQLKLVTNTDILLGMHGCSMAHAMFLPRHAVVFEMYPSFWSVQFFFSAICKWRGIKHYFWKNEEKQYEYPLGYIYIPPSVIETYLKRMRAEMCFTR